MQQSSVLPAFTASTSPDRSRWYMGHLFTFLANGAETDGNYSLIDALIRKGLEPPAHTHSRESEAYFIMDGVLNFEVGDQKFTAKAGDFVYLPNRVKHYFQLETDTAHALILIEPAGLEEFFKEFSFPAPELSLPPMPDGPPPADLLERFVARLRDNYGVDM